MNHRSQCGLFHLQNQFVFLFQTVWTPSEPAVIYQTFTESTCIQIELQTAVCAAAAAASAKQLWGETFSFSFWCPFRSARSSDRGDSDSVQIQGQLNVCHKKKPKSENTPVLSDTAARTRADLSEQTPPPWFIWIWIQTRSFCSSDQKRNMTYFLKIIKLSHRFTDQRRWMFLRVVMRLLLLFSHRLQTNNIGVLMRHWVSVRPSVTHWVQNIYILGESEKGREWRGPPKPWRDISGGQN